MAERTIDGHGASATRPPRRGLGGGLYKFRLFSPVGNALRPLNLTAAVPGGGRWGLAGGLAGSAPAPTWCEHPADSSMSHCASPSRASATLAPTGEGIAAPILGALRARGLGGGTSFTVRLDGGPAMGTVDYRLAWTDGPTVRALVEALAGMTELGPVRLHFDRRWSPELRATAAVVFERATGVMVLDRSGQPGGPVSSVWGLVPLAGRRAWEWWADYVDGWVTADELPQPTARDLRAWRRSPHVHVRREAVRRVAGAEALGTR